MSHVSVCKQCYGVCTHVFLGLSRKHKFRDRDGHVTRDRDGHVTGTTSFMIKAVQTIHSQGTFNTDSCQFQVCSMADHGTTYFYLHQQHRELSDGKES